MQDYSRAKRSKEAGSASKGDKVPGIVWWAKDKRERKENIYNSERNRKARDIESIRVVKGEKGTVL